MRNHRTFCHSAAFTLLEVMVAFAVLAALVGTVSQLMSDGSRRLKVTANSFFAMQLASKVMTDLAEDAQSNPAFLEFLGSYPEMTISDPVVGGQSVYFRYLTDRLAPFGEMKPETDGGIHSWHGPIFDQFKPFRVGVSAKRLAPLGTPGYEQHVARLNIKVDWVEADGQARSYELTTLVPSPSGPKPVEPLVFEDAVMRDRSVPFLYPSRKKQTLDQVIAQTGADPEVASLAARVTILTHDLCRGLGLLSANLQRLANRRAALLAAPTAELGEVQLLIGENCEFAASLIHQVYRDLLPLVEALEPRFKVGSLPGARLGNLAAALRSFRGLPAEMMAWIREADSAYSWMQDERLRLQVSARRKALAQAKACEAKRLRFALGDLSKGDFDGFLRARRLEQSGRNPFLERFYLREEALTGKPSEFKQAYPNLETVREQVIGQAPEAQKALQGILAKLPPPKNPPRRPVSPGPQGGFPNPPPDDSQRPGANPEDGPDGDRDDDRDGDDRRDWDDRSRRNDLGRDYSNHGNDR